MKQAVLFNDPQLSVHAYAGPADGTASAARAVLKSASHTLLLNEAATELLVGYLRVIRAYFSYEGRQKQRIPVLYGQLEAQLAYKLQVSGQPMASAADITQLIQRLGCMHDWASQQQPMPQHRQAP